MPYSNGSNKLIIFFHGNAEDIGISYEMLDHLRASLKCNILAVEYPGYGIYNEMDMGNTQATGPSEDKIFSDARLVYHFALTKLDAKDIIVLGRSLGSGPATYLASHYKLGGLILMSPYTSIRNVAYTKVGMLSYVLSDQFNNLSRIGKVECPTFIVHGQKDTLIPIEQAHSLHAAC